MGIKAVTVIGAGPAGLAAALQLKRYGIQARVLEKHNPGGLLHNANLVENYPGFPGGIRGVDLVRLMTEQALGIGVRVTRDAVNELDFVDGEFKIKMASAVYHSRRVVVASGTKARKFRDFEVPEELSGRVLYEVYPLLEVSGCVIAIVGAGDAAFDYALNLARGNRVLVLNRGTELKCLPLLWERANVEPRIKYLGNVTIRELKPSSKGQILIKYITPQGDSSLAVDYLVGAIGRVPQLDFLSNNVKRDTRRLQRDGFLYLVGDVKNDIYRQTSIAVGDGILAAMEIYKREVEKDR